MSFRIVLLSFVFLNFSNHSLQANKESVALQRDYFSTSDQIDHTGLSKRINYTFNDPKLLQQALRPLLPTALQLEENKFNLFEFLGDRVLGLSITKRLMNRFSDTKRTDIHLCFVELTKNDTLTSLYRSKLMLEHFLPFPGEEKTAKYCDITEALIGAIESDDKDNGMKNVDHFLEHFMDDAYLDQLMNNIKNNQTFSQPTFILPNPAKETVNLQPAKSPIVTTPQSDIKVQVMQGDQFIGEDTDKWRSEAEELAAEQAYKHLHRDTPSKMVDQNPQSYNGRLFVDFKPSTTTMSASSTSTSKLFTTNSFAQPTPLMPPTPLEEMQSTMGSGDNAKPLQDEASLQEDEDAIDRAISLQEEANLSNVVTDSTQSLNSNSNLSRRQKANAKKIKDQEVAEKKRQKKLDAAEKNRQKQLSMKKGNIKGLRIAQREAERIKAIEDALEKTRNTVLDSIRVMRPKSSLPTGPAKSKFRVSRNGIVVPNNSIPSLQNPIISLITIQEMQPELQPIDNTKPLQEEALFQASEDAIDRAIRLHKEEKLRNEAMATDDVIDLSVRQEKEATSNVNNATAQFHAIQASEQNRQKQLAANKKKADTAALKKQATVNARKTRNARNAAKANNSTAE